MMHSYPKTYLEDAQHNLGVMFDYAIRLLKYDGDQFFLYFIQSEVAQKFEHANPKCIAGMCGIELAQNVLTKIGAAPKFPDDPKIELEKEFWLGWVLAYYQWYSGLKFSDLQEYGLVPSEILSRYILHEADISKFVSVAKRPRLMHLCINRGLLIPLFCQRSQLSREFVSSTVFIL